MIELIDIQQEGWLMDEARKLFEEYERELDEDLCFQSFQEEIKNPLKKYGPPLGVLYVAKWNSEIAGCVALTPLKEKGVCEMKRLYVRPHYRKHKIGKVLVEQVMKDAAMMGYTKMKLDTLEKLQPAIGLYKQYGFVETTSYYENPLDGVVYMEKELA
ncbi:acetyltransferase (GNAT) family protein [Lacibacter cauensis]|uniref:Acetyltransferase (GNAT) family protein n=1 Tax=Lacibacter cauensis TaxID=510947 RepID=A0A562SP67_9BACT|nr:GNAT family N-acetyltransferase [Lacibacter cauensis]TWI83089.1 acetyltransferase (GNAT) family protein [Lacibacter cauensis]